MQLTAVHERAARTGWPRSGRSPPRSLRHAQRASTTCSTAAPKMTARCLGRLLDQTRADAWPVAHPPLPPDQLLGLVTLAENGEAAREPQRSGRSMLVSSLSDVPTSGQQQLTHRDRQHGEVVSEEHLHEARRREPNRGSLVAPRSGLLAEMPWAGADGRPRRPASARGSANRRDSQYPRLLALCTVGAHAPNVGQHTTARLPGGRWNPGTTTSCWRSASRPRSCHGARPRRPRRPSSPR